jgi:hypothetical protein
MKNSLLGKTVLMWIVLSMASLPAVAQKSRIALPMVASADVPLYPPLARTANIEGVVHVKVTTDGHRVVTARTEDGQTILAAAAEKNVQTWQFTLHEPTTFTVTYRYKLVNDIKPTQNNPRVILQLPTEVEVDVLRWPKTN